MAHAFHADDIDVDADEVRAAFERGEIQLIDVREPYEHAIARIPRARLIPMRSLAASVGSLDPRREVVLLCHHGMRSAAAADFLHEQGFQRVWNLTGGIDAWSEEVDPGVKRY